MSLVPVLAFALSAGAAAAEPASEGGPTVKVGGVVYPRYGFDLTDGAEHFNSFDIDRSYVRVDAKVSDQFAGRVTLDANRMSASTLVLPDGTEVDVPADSRLRVFLKHAWLEYKPVSDVSIRFGMVDTPYLPWEESFESMRYLFRVFLDDVKLESTTDLGVSASGRHRKGLLGWGVGVFNGESFSAPEVDAGKSFQARLSVDPLATREGSGLPIGVFVDHELHQGAAPETVAGGLVGLKVPWLLATAQVAAHLSSDDEGNATGLGESVLVRPQIPDVLFLVGRLDRFDPDLLVEGDGQLKLWAGLGRDLLDKVSLAVLYEATHFEHADATDLRAVQVHGQVGF